MKVSCVGLEQLSFNQKLCFKANPQKRKELCRGHNDFVANTKQIRRASTSALTFIHIPRVIGHKAFHHRQRAQNLIQDLCSRTKFIAFPKLSLWGLIICGICHSMNIELSNDLQSLIERACNLYDRINEEIKNSNVSFCKCCSEHGWFCKISETPFEERERLIACRDSLKEVENLLIYIQRLRSWHLINRQFALNRLEESRSILIEKVSQYQGREINVIGDLKTLLFGDEKTGFDWILKDGNKKIDEKEKRQSSNFVLCCIGCGWKKAVGTAAKLIVISLSVYSMTHSYRTRHGYFRSKRNVISYINSAQGEEAETMLTISNSRVNVSYGKG